MLYQNATDKYRITGTQQTETVTLKLLSESQIIMQASRKHIALSRRALSLTEKIAFYFTCMLNKYSLSTGCLLFPNMFHLGFYFLGRCFM